MAFGDKDVSASFVFIIRQSSDINFADISKMKLINHYTDNCPKQMNQPKNDNFLIGLKPQNPQLFSDEALIRNTLLIIQEKQD